MTIATIADEIYRELGKPSDMSTPSIGFWLRNHIGDVNSLIGTSYSVSSDSVSIVPEIGEDEKSIFKKLFNIYYYNLLVRQFLGAASNDNVLEVSSDGATVRTINKNEISKSYLQLQRDEQKTLDELIKGFNNNSVSFLQVAGDDTIPAVQKFNDPNYNRI